MQHGTQCIAAPRVVCMGVGVGLLPSVAPCAAAVDTEVGSVVTYVAIAHAYTVLLARHGEHQLGSVEDEDFCCGCLISLFHHCDLWFVTHDF